MTWFIQFIAPQPNGEGGSLALISVGLSVLRVENPAQSQMTAQVSAVFAPMCTFVQLRAPACTKMKKIRNVHKAHMTAQIAL
jgi:hypothetical protein